ncbi:unnamed protein product [Tilletia controversa]|nr:unnamed protein product [Tilletia controversa]
MDQLVTFPTSDGNQFRVASVLPLGAGAYTRRQATCQVELGSSGADRRRGQTSSTDGCVQAANVGFGA